MGWTKDFLDAEQLLKLISIQWTLGVRPQASPLLIDKTHL